MFKRALIASAVFAATSGLALANGGSFAPAPAPMHTGACYVGAGISADVGHFDTSGYNRTQFFNRTTGVLASDNVFTHNIDVGGDGVNGQLFAGYGMIFQDHYTLAAEVFGDVSSLKGSFHLFQSAPVTTGLATSIDNGGSIKMNYDLGIAVLPGFMLTDSTKLYGRIGYINAHFKINDNGAVTPSNGVVVFTPAPSTAFIDSIPFSKSENESGIQLGLGLDAMVTDNVSIRGEYDWERFGRINFNHAEFVVPGSDAEFRTNRAVASGHIKIRPTIDQFTLSAIYHFFS